MAILLALLSAVAYGTADYIGGVVAAAHPHGRWPWS